MTRSLVVLSLLLVVWVVTGHTLALIALTVALFWFLACWFADDPDELAPYKWPIGEQVHQ